VSTRPSAYDRLSCPDAVLNSTDLRELGWDRRAVDAIFRALDCIFRPGHRRPYVRVRDYHALLESGSFRRDRVRPT
jgi:hypothetical protein